MQLTIIYIAFLLLLWTKQLKGNDIDFYNERKDSLDDRKSAVDIIDMAIER